jgi:hypothetical protein
MKLKTSFMTLPAPARAPGCSGGTGLLDCLARLPAVAPPAAPAGPTSAVSAVVLLRVTCTVPGWRTAVHMSGRLAFSCAPMLSAPRQHAQSGRGPRNGDAGVPC